MLIMDCWIKVVVLANEYGRRRCDSRRSRVLSKQQKGTNTDVVLLREKQ